MEIQDPKSKMVEMERKKGEKRREMMGSGGNGIGGFLLLGGVFAAAALMGAITKKARKKLNNSSAKDPIKNPAIEANCSRKEEGQGLLSLLSSPSPSPSVVEHQCIEGDGSRICSKFIQPWDSITVEHLLLEQESAPIINGEGQESHENLISVATDDDIIEGIPIQLDRPCFPDVNFDLFENESIKIFRNEEDSIHARLLKTGDEIGEREKIIKENSLTEMVKRVVEEYPSMQLEEQKEAAAAAIEETEAKEEEEQKAAAAVEDIKGKEGEEDEAVEETEAEEGSDGTGDSSMEANADAIWPFDSTEGLSEKGNEADVEISENKDENLIKRLENENRVLEETEDKMVEMTEFDGTGGSSMEANANAIWPVDSTEGLSDKGNEEDVEISENKDENLIKRLENENRVSEEKEDKMVEKTELDGTGDSSTEANAEAIWPVDSTEGLSDKGNEEDVEIFENKDENLIKRLENENRVSGGKEDKMVEMTEFDVKISEDDDDDGYADDIIIEKGIEEEEDENKIMEIEEETILLSRKEKTIGMNSTLKLRMEWWVLIGLIILLISHLVSKSYLLFDASSLNSI